jgi:hypothetical protein
MEYRLLPDITGVTFTYIGNGVKSPIRISQATNLYSVNGIPTFIFQNYSYDGSANILQLFEDGTWRLTRGIAPLGLSTTVPRQFYLIGNNLVCMRSTSIAYAKLAFDPNDGSIIGAYVPSPQPGIPQWCLGDINRGYNPFPAVLYGDDRYVYGSAWSSGNASGYDGSMQQAIKPQKGELGAVSWMAKTDNGWLSNYTGTNGNSAVGSGSGTKTGIPMGGDKVAWVTSSYRGSNHRLVIARITQGETYHPFDCNRNVMKYNADVICDLNLSDYYAGINYGPNALFPISENIFSVQCTNSSAQTQMMLVNMVAKTIQRIVTNFSWTAGCVITPNGNLLGYRVGDNTSGYNNVDIYMGSKTVDVSMPKFEVIAPPAPPLPIRASDIRTLYRSK